MWEKEKKKKGVITVEATLVLPMYILAILFIINFLNIGYMQLVIQQGLNNAGQTFSQYCYAINMLIPFDATTLSEKTVENKVEDIKGKVVPIKDFFSALSEIGTLVTNISSVEQLAPFLDKNSTEENNPIKKLTKATEQIKKEYGDLMKSAMVSGTDKLTGNSSTEKENKLKELLVDGLLLGIVNNVAAGGAEVATSFIVKSEVEQYLTEMKVNRSMLNGEISYHVFMVDKGEADSKEELSKNDMILMATYSYKPSMFSIFLKEGIPMKQVVVVRPFIGGSTDGVRQK